MNASRHRVWPSVETWGRRLVTIPLYTGLCFFAVGSFPILVVIAGLVDLLRGGPWATVRCLAFLTFYLVCEVIGIAASFLIWIAYRTWPAADHAKFLGWNFWLQRHWARALLHGGARIFDFQVRVEGGETVSPGPVVVFMRHASVGDTVLPAVLVSDRHGILLRWVMKRELLWDPCLDIVGNRLPNYFVRRGSGDGAREIAAIQTLMDGLGPGDGVLLYPEGTRFTHAKRQRILDRLAASRDPELLSRASALRRVLPPRLGGPLGLLERNQGADVLFCAHAGFEGAGSFAEFTRGALVGTVINVRFWRVSFESIPTDQPERARWLQDQWEQMDRCVEQLHEEPTRTRAPAADP